MLIGLVYLIVTAQAFATSTILNPSSFYTKQWSQQELLWHEVFWKNTFYTKNFARQIRLTTRILTFFPYHQSNLSFVQGLLSVQNTHTPGIELAFLRLESTLSLQGFNDIAFNFGYGTRLRLHAPHVDTPGSFRLNNAIIGYYFGYLLHNPVKVLQNKQTLHHHLVFCLEYTNTRFNYHWQIFIPLQPKYNSDSNKDLFFKTRENDGLRISFYVNPYLTLKLTAYLRKIQTPCVYAAADYDHTIHQYQNLQSIRELSTPQTEKGVEFCMQYAFMAKASFLFSYALSTSQKSKPSISLQWQSDGGYRQKNSKNVLRRPMGHYIVPSFTQNIDPSRNQSIQELEHFLETERTIQEEQLAQTFVSNTESQKIRLETAKLWLLMNETQRNSMAIARYIPSQFPIELRSKVSLIAFEEQSINNAYIADIFRPELRRALANFESFGAPANKITQNHLTVLWEHLESFQT